jgi:hypothetical protein
MNHGQLTEFVNCFGTLSVNDEAIKIFFFSLGGFTLSSFLYSLPGETILGLSKIRTAINSKATCLNTYIKMVGEVCETIKDKLELDVESGVNSNPLPPMQMSSERTIAQGFVRADDSSRCQIL